ncbi:MAG TPA: hypothetical protein VMJ31_00135 [Methylocystis sp.]|nr:hypothetical protein [Methylocystis sp.]
MALVEKSHGRPLGVFPFRSGVAASRRILKASPLVAVYALVFFALGFAFGHGYWFAALWLAAAALAWVFLRGASDASLPADPAREE